MRYFYYKKLGLPIFLLLVFLISFKPTKAQNRKTVDSLIQIFQSLPEFTQTEADTTKLKILFRIGNLYRKFSRDTAITYYKKGIDTNYSEQILLSNPVRSAIIGLLCQRTAASYLITGRYHEAFCYNQHALFISETINDKKNTASIYGNMGVLFYHQGKFDVALHYYQKSLTVAKELNLFNLISNCYNNIGMIFRVKGDYIAAIDYYNQSLKLAEKQHAKEEIVNSLGDLGDLYVLQGNYHKATEYFQKGLKMAEQIKYNIGIGHCNMGLGIAYRNLGDLPNSLQFIENNSKIKIKLEDKKGIAGRYIELASFFNEINNLAKAEEYYEKAYNIGKEIGSKYILIHYFRAISNIQAKKFNYKSSLQCDFATLKLSEEYGDSNLILESIFQIGNNYFGQNNYDSAMYYYNKTFEIASKINNEYYLNNLEKYKGQITYFKKNYAIALQNYKNALQFYLENGIINDAVEVYRLLGALYCRINNLKDAAECYMNAQQIIISLLSKNFMVMSEKEKEQYFDQLQSVFNNLHEFNLVFVKNNDSMISLSYKNELILKGLILNSSGQIIKQIQHSKDTVFINAYWKLKQLRNTIADLQNKNNAIIEINIDSLEMIANDQERELVRHSSNLTTSQNHFTAHWIDIREKLNPNDAAIELVKINHTLTRPDTCTTDSFSYAALLLKPGMPHPEMIPLCDEISLSKIVGTIGWSDPTLVKLIYQKGSRKGLRLYQKIWQPLEPYLKDVKTIYIAPTGLLHQIAFHAIPCPDSSLLSDKYYINMVSSTRILADSAMQKPLFAAKNSSVAIFGGIRYEPDTTLLASLSQYHKTNTQQLALRFKESNATRSSAMPWQYLYGTMQEATTINNLLQQKKIKSTFYSGSNALEEYFK